VATLCGVQAGYHGHGIRLVGIMKGFLLTFFLWLGAWGYAVESVSPDSAAPLWSANEIQDSILARTSGASRLIDGNRAGVTFLDDHQLLLHQVLHDTGQLSSRQSPETSSPFRLHLSVLEAGSGRQLLTRDWGTRFHESSIQVTAGGVVVQTGEILRVLSKDFTVLQQITLPKASYEYSDPMISVSPSGKTFLINRFNQKLNISHFDVFDGSTFQGKVSWIESPPLYHLYLYSISDQGISALGFNQKGVFYSEFSTGKWKQIGDKTFGGPPNFITDKELVAGADGQLCLVDIQGHSEVLSKVEEPLEQKRVVSQDGRFIAIALAHLDIKKHILSEASMSITARRIGVYDLSARKWVLTVDAIPLPDNDYDFALSPDGSKLAILNDRKISVYAVPLR